MKKLFVTGGSGFIGSNLILYFSKLGWKVTNYDIKPPLDTHQIEHWVEGDLLDQEKIEEALAHDQPDHVLHLAARTDCDENTTVEDGYRSNTVGTSHLLSAVGRTPSVKRLIVTSTQFVCGPGYNPESLWDYSPVTVYGQSKVETEERTRKANLDCTWTIIRPTNIWGPWHARYEREFWKVVAKGFYVHPGGEPVIRCYGYVGNIIHWINAIYEADPAKVHQQAFYLSDPADDIYKWANAFSRALVGRSPPRIPRYLLSGLGKVGDIITSLQGKEFYITSSRYSSMTTHYHASHFLESTYATLGPPKVSLQDGVGETIFWLKHRRPERAKTRRDYDT